MPPVMAEVVEESDVTEEAAEPEADKEISGDAERL